MSEESGLKHWQYDPQWGTVLSIRGCQFGFKTDGRCDRLLCKFRTREREAPDRPMESCRVLCPREMEAGRDGRD